MVAFTFLSLLLSVLARGQETGREKLEFGSKKKKKKNICCHLYNVKRCDGAGALQTFDSQYLIILLSNNLINMTFTV